MCVREEYVITRNEKLDEDLGHAMLKAEDAKANDEKKIVARDVNAKVGAKCKLENHKKKS